MLIITAQALPFDKNRSDRLSCLEHQLRQASEGELMLSDYKYLIEKCNLSVPSRKTLYLDLLRYAEYCDDIIYGDQAKKLMINTQATADAQSYLLGRPWLNSPLQPAVYSSRLRCILLAMHTQHAIKFDYRALRASGSDWYPRPMWGIPQQLLPGMSSGYLQIYRPDYQHITNLNLARIQGVVRWCTDVDQSKKEEIPLDPWVTITLSCNNPYFIERLCQEFLGFVPINKYRVQLQVQKSKQVMTLDILTAYISRTNKAQRNYPQQFDCGEVHFQVEETRYV